MPVPLSSLPESVASFAEVSNAMQKAAELCALLANQRGLVANSYVLRVTLLTHLFLRVLPMPLPRHRSDRASSCFWGRASASITHDTQAEIMRWLALLCRHFTAASLSLPLTPSSDATRMLVLATMAAIADATLRLTACDVPSALSLRNRRGARTHYYDPLPRYLIIGCSRRGVRTSRRTMARLGCGQWRGLIPLSGAA